MKMIMCEMKKMNDSMKIGREKQGNEEEEESNVWRKIVKEKKWRRREENSIKEEI